MKKTLLIGGLIIIILAAFVFLKKDKKTNQTQETQPQENTNESAKPENVYQKDDSGDKMPELGVGDSGKSVVLLHQKLSDLDLFPKDLVDVDRYGEKTQHSVMVFQTSQGLEPNGVVDDKTWDALNNPKPFNKDDLDLSHITIDDGHVSENVSDNDLHKADDKKDVKADDKTSKAKPDNKKHEDGKKVVYLTFDDGPNKTWTPKIKALLDKYEAKATFFTIGKNVEQFPDLVHDEAKDKCAVGNHTYTHINLETASHSDFMNEIKKTNKVIKKATGKEPYCIRPPYGSISKKEKQEIKDIHMELVLWDVDPQDWSRPGTKNISNHVLKYVQPGEIVLMHDGGGDRSQTLEALEAILKKLKSDGWVFKSFCEV